MIFLKKNSRLPFAGKRDQSKLLVYKNGNIEALFPGKSIFPSQQTNNAIFYFLDLNK